MADKQILPTPKSSPGTVFNDRLNELAVHADASAKAAVGTAPAEWYIPGDFTKTIYDLDAIHNSFDRRQQEEEFVAAVAHPESIGTIGDLAMTQLQGDTLACLERAFRARHHSACRSRVQPAARLAGQAAETGVIKFGMIGYINNIDRINKGEKA
jgi:hypothetical protein